MQSIKQAPLTEGKIFSKMILFVLPIMATGILQLLYNSADSIIVGRFSGDPNALGAVGSTGSVTALVINMLMGIGAGTSVLVADFIRYFCGMFVVVGHIFPVTMRFKGGKGIASTLGLFWVSLSCENIWLLLISFAWLLCLVVFILLTEWGSLGSLLGVSVFSVIQLIIFFFRYNEQGVNAYLVCTYSLILVINLLTWFAHHKNLARLFSGEEHRTSIKKLAQKRKMKKESDKV